MKKGKTKSILALLGTLVIGMVIGGLIASSMFRAHIRKYKDLREPGGFRKRMIKVIDPTEEQKAKIEPIIKEFGQTMKSMHIRHMMEARSNMEVFHESLSVYLTPEQMDALKKEAKRMHGPHGPGGHHNRKHRREMMRKHMEEIHGDH